MWEYDPGLFKRQNIVDPVSLYASLKEEKDERVEQAFETVLDLIYKAIGDNNPVPTDFSPYLVRAPSPIIIA